MNISKCRCCGENIPNHFYANALFCSDLCRKRHWDITKRPCANKIALKSFKGVVGFGLKENVNKLEPEVTFIHVYKYGNI